MFMFGIILLFIGTILYLTLYLTEDSAIVFFSALSMALIIAGLFSTVIKPEQTVSQLCEEYAICYELVETVAENTKYSEEDVAKFFVIVSDDMEAWDAIRMLDNSLTDEQINALMEISAMKQAE